MADPERSALVVRGGWPGHEPVATTDLFVPFLRSAGFAVRVEESPAVYADAGAMAGSDLVVQALSMSRASAEAVAGLSAAVRAGTGLVGWHGGIVDAFREHPDYLQLIGGVFAHHAHVVPPEERTGIPADVMQPHTIDITPLGRQHPITAGLDDFALVSEQYWVLTDAYDEVLATTTQAHRDFDPWHRPVTFPAVWTRSWGAGRVVVCTPGHSPEDVAHPSVRTVLERGMLWAARP